MKNLPLTYCSTLIVCAIGLFISSCKRDHPVVPPSGEAFEVSFAINTFDVIKNKSYQLSAVSSAIGPMLKSMSSPNIPEEHYLYYWSFNSSSLKPQISLHANASLQLYPSNGRLDYKAGWSYDGIAAGRSIELQEWQELVFYMPIPDVYRLNSIGFDISSDDKGPKDFRLSYSQDGINYRLIAAQNPFHNNKSRHARHTFDYSLAALPLDTQKPLYVKIVPMAGIRGDDDYDLKDGETRIDNFFLKGQDMPIYTPSVNQLHYHIFHRNSGLLAAAGTQHFHDLSQQLRFSLLRGDYIGVFALNKSEQELLLSNNAEHNLFYIANRFDNALADIYGLVDSFTIQGPLDKPLYLDRFYSEIKFEFTDTEDMPIFDRFEITRKHQPFIFTPFDQAFRPTLPLGEKFVLKPDFVHGQHEIMFHQFLGILEEEEPIAYQVDVYAEDQSLLLTFDVATAVKNNMQVIFRGNLLTVMQQEGSFDIILKDEWSDTIVEPF